MSFPQGVNFRSTSTFVTDATNFTYDIDETNTFPRTSPQGNSIGWVAGGLTNTNRDRTSTNDPRLAGNVFNTAATYEITLPAAGTYTLNLAVGDVYGRSNNQVQVYDGGTFLSTLFTGATSGANSFLDAAGNLWSAAAWPGSNVGVNFTFATTACKIVIGDGTNFTFLASIELTSAGSPTAAGSLVTTFSNFTLAGTGTATAAGALAVTFPDFTLAGTGKATAAGALAATFPDFTLAGTGTATAAGALALTFSDFTLVGTGTVTSGPSGSLSATFGDFTLAGTGTATAAGALAVTFGNFTLAGTGTATAAGTLAITFGDFTLAGTGTVLAAAAGTLAITFGDFTLVATGFVPLPPAPAITYATVFTEADLILAMRLARRVYRLTGVMSPGYTNMVAVYRQLQSGSPISNTQPTTSEARKSRISYGLGGYRRRQGRRV